MPIFLFEFLLRLSLAPKCRFARPDQELQKCLRVKFQQRYVKSVRRVPLKRYVRPKMATLLPPVAVKKRPPACWHTDSGRITLQRGVFRHLIFLARSSMPRKDTMDLRDIIAQLHAQRGRLDQAIAALEGSAPRRGRPPRAVTNEKRRVMSAAARKRISAAMRARWAVRKRSGSPAKRARAKAKKSSHRPPMSPAAKKKLSALMKARWAARKQQRKAA